MLQSIRLKDFKSFADEQVALAPLTVLVGANASGKSNLLDAIRFVQGLGLGLPLLDVLQGRWEAGRETWRGLRGGVAETIRHGQQSARVATTWSLRDQPWVHQVEFTTSQPQPFISRESFGHPDAPQGEFLEAPPKTSGPILKTQSILRMIPHSPVVEVGVLSSKGVEAVEQLLDVFRDSVFLAPSPDRMREYSPKQAVQLRAEGEHLSSALWSLCQDAQARREWVDWLSELLAPDLADFDFIETELGDVMLTLVEADGTRTSARSMSDGTLRFLGTLVALRTASPGSFVLIEEPETGLHPQRIHLLVEYMEAVTRERGIQLIATTHSPQLLQSLSSESLRNTVLCARLPDHPGTVLRRLGDLPHFDEVTTRSSIDHLFTTGWLERAL